MKSYKGYKEMTRCVLEARDEHLKKKRHQQAMIRRCAPAMASFCIALILGFSFWTHKMPETEPLPSIAESSAESVDATEKGTSAIEHNEAQTTQKPAERSTAQNVTNNETSTTISQETYTANTETESPAAHSEIIEAPAETYGEPAKTEPTFETAPDTTTQQPTLEDGQSGCGDNHNYLHWDEMTINQQYFMAEFGEPVLSYSTAEKEVTPDNVGEYLSKAYMSGYDWYEFIYYHCETEAYKIKGDDKIKSIAIKFDDDEKYYLYTLNEPNNEDQLSG